MWVGKVVKNTAVGLLCWHGTAGHSKIPCRSSDITPFCYLSCLVGKHPHLLFFSTHLFRCFPQFVICLYIKHVNKLQRSAQFLVSCAAQSLHLLTHPDVLFRKHSQIAYVTWLSATLSGLNVFQIRIKARGSDSNCCLSESGPRSHETYHGCFWCLAGTCLGCMFSAVSSLCLPVCCPAVRQICNDTRYRRWKSAQDQVGLITPSNHQA